MKNIKILLSNISASAINTSIISIINPIYIFIIARLFTKEDFGLYNYSLSIATIIGTVCLFGINSVITRRIAVSEFEDSTIINNSIVHLLLIQSFLSIILICYIIIVGFSREREFFFILAIYAVFFSNYVTIFRQALIGFEKLWPITKFTFIAIIGKIFFGIGLVIIDKPILEYLYLALFLESLVNIILMVIYFQKTIRIKFYLKIKLNEYIDLLQESFPFVGMAIFTSTLARIDWILIGEFLNDIKVAEYSFAYRCFEFTWFPHVVLGPILLTKFSKKFKNKAFKKNELNKTENLFRMIISLSILLPILTILFWTPIIDYFTEYKYGAINQNLITVLVLSVPFLASTSFMWNYAVSIKQGTKVLFIISLTLLLNVIFNFILIPMYGNIGAALSSISTSIIQATLYYLIIFREKFVIKTILHSLQVLIVIVILYQVLIESNFIILVLISLIIYSIYFFMSNNIKELKAIYFG